MVYLNNKISAFSTLPDVFVNMYQFGDVVEINGVVSRYTTPYCGRSNPDSENKSCNYFVINKTSGG